MNIVKIWKITPPDYNLEQVELEENPISIAEAAKSIPQGVYTTFRTFEKTRTLPLEAHFKRLRESAGLVNQTISMDDAKIKDCLRECLKRRNLDGETRIRISIDLELRPGEIYFVLEPLAVPSLEDYRSGVKVQTYSFQRQNPHAKTTNHLTAIEGIRQTMLKQVNEILLLDKTGFILEGVSSNFFAVKHGEIWTAGEGVLEGIIRSITLELAQKNALHVHLQAIPAGKILALDEAFITSASRAILPVTTIDATLVGDGKPGPVTRKLIKAYEGYIQQNVVEI